MTSILTRVLVHAGKVSAYHAIKNRSGLQKFNRNNLKTYSSLINTKSTTPFDEDPEVDELLSAKDKPSISVLEELPKLPDISHITPELRPSLNFAYFANKSEVIQEFIKLGVDFHQIEQKERLPSFLLQLDFEKDVKTYISFLYQNGVASDDLGQFFTKNSFILEENLDDLQVRINYLQSKNFTSEMISRILTACPRWLNFPTKDIDKILGNFQKELKLTGDEVRYVICKRPQLILIPRMDIQGKLLLFKEVIGFTVEQTKNIFLKQPYIWSVASHHVQERLDIILRDMEIPLSLIEAQPSGLLCRASRLKERHLFLKELRKAQYDPTKPGYVSLDDISKGNDVTFCQKAAKTSIETYNLFLKTL